MQPHAQLRDSVTTGGASSKGRRWASHAAVAALLLLLLCGLLRPARACTVIQLLNDGFATNALYLMRVVPLFYGQNGTLFVDNTDFPYACAQDGGFHDFFRHDERLVPWSAAKEAAAGEACRRVTFQDIDDIIYNTLKVPHYHLELIGMQRAWWYRRWVWQWIKANSLAQHASAPQPTIAFHIRGGDVFEADNEEARPSTTPADYIQTFRWRYPHVKGGTCIFAGDQYSQLLQAAEIAQEALGCEARFGATFPLEEGYSTEAFAELELDARCEATLQLLGDMEVLARADYFVSSYHSMWSNLVEWMRYALYHKDRSTSADASEEHADLHSRIATLFTKRSQAQQGSEEMAGEAAGELTELELEEAAAVQTQHQHSSGDAANTASPKGFAGDPAADHLALDDQAEAAGSLAQVAACQGQDCWDGQSGREALWEIGGIRAGDGQSVTGFAGAMRRHEAVNGGSG